MSSKISVEQLNANTAAYAIDDFRKMVNYENVKNKGYVRFTLGSDGGLKLEKFNRKIDLPLSWRSNTSAAHNRAMREKFADALSGDLKYALEETRTRIRNMVLSPENDEGQVQAGKALSRREVMAALEEFDKVYNSTGGRQSILHNFFKAAMKEANFRGDLETFKRDYLKLDDHGLGADALEKFCSEVEDPTGKKSQRDRMVKNEMEFRTVIVQLEGLLKAAKMRVGVDNCLKDLAGAALEKGDAFGLDLKSQGGGKLLSDMRACLTNLLALDGVKDAAKVEVFLEKVLPFYVSDGIANARAYAGDDPAKLEAAIDANFDFEDLVKLAEEFVKGAADAEKNPVAVKPLAEEDYGILQGTMENLRATQELIDINAYVSNTVMQNAAVKATYAKQIAGSVVSMKALFKSEAAVDNFAARFVMKHFANATENVRQKDATTLDEVKKYVQKQLVPALQLQYGERWANGNGRYTENHGAPEFIDCLVENIQSAVDALECGKDLYEKLFSYTLPNIINQRVDNAVHDGDRLHFVGGDDLKIAISQIVRTGMAYRDFTRKKVEGLVNKSIDGFRKILQKQLKKENITPNQFSTLMNDFITRMKSARAQTLKRYFVGSPPPVRSENTNEDVKIEVQRLLQLFQEEKNAAVAELSARLKTAILAHSLGGIEGLKAKRELMDATKAVDDIVNSIPDRKPPLEKQLAGNVLRPSLRSGLEKLYFQTLDDMLTARKVKKNPVDDKFVKDVLAAFAKRADDFLKKADAYAQKLDAALRGEVVSVINGQIEGGGQVMRDHAKLGKADRQTLVDCLAKDVMLAENNRVAELKARFLENPDVYGKESAKDVVEREFGVDYTPQNIARTVIRVAKERIFAFAAWLEAKDEQGRTFEEKLLSDAKLRIQQENPDFSAAEVANIVKPQVDAVMKEANDFLLLYTVGGKDGFENRVNAKLASALDARMKAYTDFRTQFLKLTADTLKTHSSLGQTMLDRKLAMVFDEASAQIPPPDAKVAAHAFDKMLSDLIKGIIDRKFEKYLELSEAYTKAFENANPVLNAKVEARAAELKEAGATDEDVQFFRDAIVPRLREQMEFELYDKPQEWFGEAGKEKAAKFFDDTFKVIKRDVTSVKFDTSNEKEFEDNLRFFLSVLDFAEFMDDASTKAAVKANIATWLKADETKTLVTGMRRAMMTLHVYDRKSEEAPAKAAKAAVDRFYAGLRAAVVGMEAQNIMGSFNEIQLKPALKLFELWLEQYDLPKTEIKRNNETITLKQKAMEHFTERVRDLQQRIANEGKEAVKEPLLSAEYVKSFLTFINEQGTELMMIEMRDTVKARAMERMMAEAGELFDDVAAKTNQVSSHVLAAIAVNKVGLISLLDKNMDIVEKEMRAETPTLESLKRWRTDIEERFAKHMLNTTAFKVSCDLRVRHVRQLDAIVEKSQAFLLGAIGERFAGENLATSAKISEKTRIGGGEGGVPAFLGDLMNNFYKQVAEKADDLLRSAVKYRDPLGSQKIFLTDTERNSALSNEFRDLARACVTAACETKAFRGLVKQIDKDLGIRR